MKKNRALFILSLALLLLAATIAAAAGAGTPGSQDDPVVTKSYVDGKLAELAGSGGTSAGDGAVFRVVEVEAGKKVLGGAGTEMILRGGEAQALDNGADGVSDLTAGTDLKGGTEVARNHLLLIPLEDGRGIQITAKAWVMVKGTYTVQ